MRITGGHRAAVCGLVLAGVPYRSACHVVGIGRRTIAPLIPVEYRSGGRPTAREWQMKKAREGWSAGTKLERIAVDADLTVSGIYRIAKREGWARGVSP